MPLESRDMPEIRASFDTARRELPRREQKHRGRASMMQASRDEVHRARRRIQRVHARQRQLTMNDHEHEPRPYARHGACARRGTRRGVLNIDGGVYMNVLLEWSHPRTNNTPSTIIDIPPLQQRAREKLCCLAEELVHRKCTSKLSTAAEKTGSRHNQ